MFASQLISSVGVRSSQLACPRGCSVSSSGSNITHDGSTMCNSCGLILKSDEFEAEFQCGGLDKIRPESKPWMLSYENKLNGSSKCYNYFSNSKDTNVGRSNSTMNTAGSVFNIVNLNVFGGHEKLEQLKTISAKNECSRSTSSLSNPAVFTGTLKEEYLVGKTISSWETRQREIGRQVGELCARSQLNNAEREEISDLAESMLRALDTRNKKCRSIRSLVAACFYECSKRARRPVAINELCQYFQVKQRKLLKYSKKLQKYHHAHPLSHSQRVSNEWEQMTGHMFEKLPSFIQFSRSSICNEIQGKGRNCANQRNDFGVLGLLLKEEEVEGALRENIAGSVDKRLGSSFSRIFDGKQSFQQVRQQKQKSGIETTYVPEVHSNSTTIGTSGNCLLFRQQLREVEEQNTVMILKNIQKQLKQLYDCEYLSTMRMGKHPGNFICTLLYVLLKSHGIQFQNNTFCKVLGVKYSTLSREKKQLHLLLVDSLVFSQAQQLPEQIVQELDTIRSHRGQNQINDITQEIDQRSKIRAKKSNDSISLRCVNDNRLSEGFLAYALEHILRIEDSTILMHEAQFYVKDGDNSQKVEQNEDTGRNIEEEQEDNLLLSCESTSIASSSLGEQTTSNLNDHNNHFLVSNATAA